MSQVPVVFYRDDSQEVLLLEWLKEKKVTHRNGYNRINGVIKLLGMNGNSILYGTSGHTYAAKLKNKKKKRKRKIYELRVDCNNYSYRPFFFFHKQIEIVLLFAVEKQDDHPREFEKAIDRAEDYRQKYVANPEAHRAIIDLDSF